VLTRAKIPHLEVMHPNWPTIFPSLLTDGRLVSAVEKDLLGGKTPRIYTVAPLDARQKQLLWECEQERFTFKACLRRVLAL
jgi:hypothetical protein